MRALSGSRRAGLEQPCALGRVVAVLEELRALLLVI